MKLFQNKFFLICLCVALVLAIVPSTFALMGYGGLAKNIVSIVTYPFRFVFSAIADGFSGWGMYFASIEALNAENAALEAENKYLNDRLGQAELLEAENERLRNYLGMKDRYPSFTMEEGMVIDHSSGNYITTFTINRGSVHGIEVNMPVVTADGIVGMVKEVGLNYCKVYTIIETATAVGAYVERSGAGVIVNGDYSMKFDGLCKLEYADPKTDIREGDTILSSGRGSVYPAGLKIGTVTKIEIDEYNRMLEVTIKPAVDMSDLRWVMVITGYESGEALEDETDGDETDAP